MPFRFLSTDGSNSTAWRTLTDMKVVAGGAWQRVLTAKAMIDGSWRTVFNYDTVGPAAVTNMTAVWDNSAGNKCSVTFTQPTDADFARTDLFVNRSGSNTGPWTFISSFTGTGVQSYTDTTITLSPVNVYNSNDKGVVDLAVNYKSPTFYFRAVPYDQVGNAGTAVVVGSTGQNSNVVRGMYASPFYITANNGGTWRGTWRTDATVLDSQGEYSTAIQGYTASGQNYGFFFYAATPYAEGLNVFSGDVYLKRQPHGTGGSVRAYMRATTAIFDYPYFGINPVSGETTSSLVYGGLQAWNAGAWNAIPLDWVTGLINGDWGGIRVYTGETTLANGVLSQNYAPYYGAYDFTATQLPGGLLRAYHSG